MRALREPALRLLLITDGRGDVERIEAIAATAVRGGVRAVQLREPQLSARQLAGLCERLRPLFDAEQGLLFVNDRLDVALLGAAHGAQVGHRSLPPELARRVLGPLPWLGFSAHDGAELWQAAAAGCDFALLAPVWPPSNKTAGEPLGVDRAARLTATAPVPVLWLGGIDARRAATIGELPVAQRPIGVAVCGAICTAADPGAAARDLVRACAWP